MNFGMPMLSSPLWWCYSAESQIGWLTASFVCRVAMNCSFWSTCSCQHTSFNWPQQAGLWANMSSFTTMCVTITETYMQTLYVSDTMYIKLVFLEVWVLDWPGNLSSLSKGMLPRAEISLNKYPWSLLLLNSATNSIFASANYDFSPWMVMCSTYIWRSGGKQVKSEGMHIVLLVTWNF